MNILFIGNSYTYYNDLPSLLQRLAAENGKDITVSSVTKGGWKLFQYLDVPNEYAEKLSELIDTSHFDAVFLQEQSLLPILDFDAFSDGVARLKSRLSEKASRIILYETWGRKEGSQTLTEHGWTRDGMTTALSEAYARVGEQNGLEVSHVGLAFRTLNDLDPAINLHHTDLTHPSYTGSCLAAAVHYKTLFGESPKHLSFPNLSEAEITAIRRVL